MDPVLESRIRLGARQGALPHSVIFSGSGDLLAAARFYTAALECRQADKPCLRCPACGKVLRGTHPDCVTAEDSQHKDLSVEEARAKYAGEYVEKVAGAVNAAKDGMVDDIIDPAKTRAMLISALEMLGSKRDSNPPKKHDNLPM